MVKGILGKKHGEGDARIGQGGKGESEIYKALSKNSMSGAALE